MHTRIYKDDCLIGTQNKVLGMIVFTLFVALGILIGPYKTSQLNNQREALFSNCVSKLTTVDAVAVEKCSLTAQELIK